MSDNNIKTNIYNLRKNRSEEKQNKDPENLLGKKRANELDLKIQQRTQSSQRRETKNISSDQKNLGKNLSLEEHISESKDQIRTQKQTHSNQEKQKIFKTISSCFEIHQKNLLGPKKTSLKNPRKSEEKHNFPINITNNDIHDNIHDNNINIFIIFVTVLHYIHKQIVQFNKIFLINKMNVIYDVNFVRSKIIY